MSTKTAIQWTDVTDNIIVVEGGGWWCRMCSPGCANCYAAALNQSEFYGGNKLPYRGDPPRLVLRMDLIDGWKRQKHPKKHFVASMTDIFGEWVPFEMALGFLRGMWSAPKQTFQILTKRPSVMEDYIYQWLKQDGLGAVPPNIWVGTSVEDQERADERIHQLRDIPARVRFLSVEPMLEHITLQLKSNDINWVIFGGESGPKARPCHIEWVTSGVAQCIGQNVPAFVKQLGKLVLSDDPDGDGWPEGTEFDYNCTTKVLLKHPKGGNMEEWPQRLRVRQFPDA